MPNDDHIATLGRGAAAWNAWRAEHDEAPDLSRGALRGLDLSGFDLSQVELRSADLRGTQFCDADLSGADLEGANLFKAFLDGADLAGPVSTARYSSIVLSSSSPETGNRLFAMKRS